MDGMESGALAAAGLERERSRRDFLKTAAWATAAISAAGIGGFGVATKYADAQAAAVNYPTYQGLGDAAILQFAYLLEQLEGNFYAGGINAGLFSSNSFAATQIAAIRDHEFAHADALAATIGKLGAAVPAVPTFTYPADAFTNPTSFLGYAATFEPVGIGAYGGAAAALQSKDILAAAISIHNAECQHRTAINILNGVVPANNLAFEPTLPLGAVKQAVAPFGVTG